MKNMLINVVAIAMAAHEVNRAYCASLGDDSQASWDDAPQWQKDSAIAGVKMHIGNPDASPEQSHEGWLAQKVADGWVYGDVKDAEAKQHPCCLPYADLPLEQKAKDYLFRATVHALVTIDKDLPRKAAVRQASVLTGSPSIENGVAVTYIGRRESWLDNQYSTGLSFSVGQTRVVPGDIAAKFLRHQDLFAASEADTKAGPDDTAALLANAAAAKDQAKDEVNSRQDVVDSVMNMEKDALKDFAMTHYQQKLNGTFKVENLREQVIGMIDQYGIS